MFDSVNNQLLSWHKMDNQEDSAFIVSRKSKNKINHKFTGHFKLKENSRSPPQLQKLFAFSVLFSKLFAFGIVLHCLLESKKHFFLNSPFSSLSHTKRFNTRWEQNTPN